MYSFIIKYLDSKKNLITFKTSWNSAYQRCLKSIKDNNYQLISIQYN